jgi:hypothetical protein
VDVVSLVYDVEDQVRPTINEDDVGRDVETDRGVHERDAHDLGAAAGDALGRRLVKPAGERERRERAERDDQGDGGGDR